MFDQTSGCLAINGELTVYQAAEAKRVLLEVTNTDCLRSLDLSGVTEFDSAGLQLLLCLQDVPSAVAVDVVNPSDSVLSVLALTSLQQRVLGVEQEKAK